MRPTNEQFQKIATLNMKLIWELERVDQLLEYMELNEENDLYCNFRFFEGALRRIKEYEALLLDLKDQLNKKTT